MKKVLLLVLFVSIRITTLFAQNYYEYADFQLSFVPPLSTQGTKAPYYMNAVSVNILAGVSRNVTKFSFSGMGMYVVEDIYGIHLSGLATVAGGHGEGVMISGLLNKVGAYHGLQFSGLLNMVQGMNGIQLSGLGNLNRGVMNGIQFSGLLNTAAAMRGIQFGGLVNIGGQMRGFQLGGLVNTAQNVSGFQIAGLVNVAKVVRGFQLGALVNVAEWNEYPIGLVNIIKYGGEMSLGVTYNEIGSTMLSFRSGGRVLYGIVGLGYNHELTKRKMMTEAGLGGHIPISKRFRINNELKINTVVFTDKETTSHSSFSILPAFKIIPKWEIFAGPSLSYFYSDNIAQRGAFTGHHLWRKFTDTKLKQLNFGFTIGTHCLF